MEDLSGSDLGQAMAGGREPVEPADPATAVEAEHELAPLVEVSYLYAMRYGHVWGSVDKHAYPVLIEAVAGRIAPKGSRETSGESLAEMVTLALSSPRIQE